jgi:hypothetical protein
MQHVNHSESPYAKPFPSPNHTDRTSLTPGSPAPAYGSEIHELSTSTMVSYGAGHGLGFENLETLQEAEAQSDTPNPYPVQREWSARRRPELPDTAAREAVESRDDGQNRGRFRESSGRREGRESYSGWQTYSS